MDNMQDYLSKMEIEMRNNLTKIKNDTKNTKKQDKKKIDKKDEKNNKKDDKNNKKDDKNNKKDDKKKENTKLLESNIILERKGSDEKIPDVLEFNASDTLDQKISKMSGVNHGLYSEYAIKDKDFSRIESAICSPTVPYKQKKKENIKVDFSRFSDMDTELIAKALTIIFINHGFTEQQIIDYFDVDKSKDTKKQAYKVFLKINNLFPVRHYESIRKHCYTVFCPFKRGPISAKEELELIDLVKKFGHKWKEVSSEMGRLRYDIESYYNMHGLEILVNNKNINKNDFTFEEVVSISNLVEEDLGLKILIPEIYESFYKRNRLRSFDFEEITQFLIYNNEINLECVNLSKIYYKLYLVYNRTRYQIYKTIKRFFKNYYNWLEQNQKNVTLEVLEYIESKKWDDIADVKWNKIKKKFGVEKDELLKLFRKVIGKDDIDFSEIVARLKEKQTVRKPKLIKMKKGEKPFQNVGINYLVEMYNKFKFTNKNE